MAGDRTKFRDVLKETIIQGVLTVPQVKTHARASLLEARRALYAGQYAEAGDELDFSVWLIKAIQGGCYRKPRS